MLPALLTSPFMSQFLTIKDAAQRIGKSPSSVRRVIYPIIQNDKHPDRKHVQPTPEEALQLRLKGENFPWQISEELLAREYPPESVSRPAAATSPSRAPEEGNHELLAMLRRELDIKNQQITQQSQMLSQQMELISGLSERLREGNVLIGSLQQRMTLGDGGSRSTADVVDAKPKPEPATKSETAPKPAPPKPKKPVKKSFLARIFG